MKILTLLCSLLMGCSTLQEPRHSVLIHSCSPHTTRARITFYTGHHERVAATGHRAVEGKSVAAHPKYPFGTKIAIPELTPFLGKTNLNIEDRGPAVTSRKASHKTADVFDIFVSNKQTMRRLEKDAPEYMTVTIL